MDKVIYADSGKKEKVRRRFKKSPPKNISFIMKIVYSIPLWLPVVILVPTHIIVGFSTEDLGRVFIGVILFMVFGLLCTIMLAIALKRFSMRDIDRLDEQITFDDDVLIYKYKSVMTQGRRYYLVLGTPEVYEHYIVKIPLRLMKSVTYDDETRCFVIKGGMRIQTARSAGQYDVLFVNIGSGSGDPSDAAYTPSKYKERTFVLYDYFDTPLIEIMRDMKIRINNA